MSNETYKYELGLLGKRITINNNATEVSANKELGKADTTS